MKAFVLYHPESEYARTVEDYVTEFEKIKNKKIELISLESKDGAILADLYGVVQYPAIVVKRDNNELVSLWQGSLLPLMNEVDGSMA